MTAICRRELKGLLTTVTGWLFLALIVFLPGLYFSVYSANGMNDLSYTLTSASMIFVIAMPILTMRVFSEERRNRTDQLLLTSPVSIRGIVLGKYLACEALFAASVLPVCFFPLIMARYGPVLYAQSYMAILGYFLYGSLCIAIGLWISSLTESVVLAAVGSIAVIFLGFVMTGITGLISEEGNALTAILSVYDPSARFSRMLGGTLELAPMVYFVTLILWFLFLTGMGLIARQHRFTVTEPGTRQNLMVYSASVCVVTLCLLFSNLVVSRLPASLTMRDLTPNHLYTLSEETKQYIRSLPQDVQIYVLTRDPASLDLTLTNSLRSYEALSDRLHVQMIDPVYQPTFYQQFTDTAPAEGSIIVSSGGIARVIAYDALFERRFNMSTYSYDILGYDGEGQLTSAIASVVTGVQTTLYMLAGHGESALSEDFIQAAEKLGIRTETMNLVQMTEIPAASSVVLINVPQEDLSADDLDKLGTYVRAGGSLFINTGYRGRELSRLQSLLAMYGVQSLDGMVLEEDSRYYYSRVNYILPVLTGERLLDPVRESGYVFAPFCGALAEEETAASVTPLLLSSETSFLRVNALENSGASRQAEDVTGQFTLGLMSERPADQGGSRATILASDGILTAEADEAVSGNNLRLFATLMRELLPASVAAFSIPAKSYDTGFLMLPEGDVYGLLVCWAVILPLALLAVGVWIWIRRTRKG